jgi:protein involved in temperature-dependent protein secretion
MDKTTILNEIRYAERLCQRTARMYRHLQSCTVFLTVLGGSAVMSTLTTAVPVWLPSLGAVVFALFGAANLAIRPADKAAINESDGRRYTQLRTAAASMDAQTLQVALDKTREGDAPEVESLREVAYNDVVIEIGRSDAVIQLTPLQHLLRVLA